MAPTSARLADWRLSFPPGSRSRKPRPSSATAYPACATTSPPIYYSSEAVLGAVAERLGRMETATHSRHTTNGRRLASCRVSAVLEVAFPSSIDGREKADPSRGSCLDFSDGGREPDMGSATHSWRVAHAALPPLGSHRFTMDAPSAQIAAPRPALVDVSPQPSRGHRRHGLRHRPDPHLRRSVGLLRDRPRPAANPALQRDS